jgi:hypothetical protein
MMLETCVLRIIQAHQGRANAITAPALTAAVREALGTYVSERDVRDVISNLRKRCHPIASSVREPFGYFWPTTELEAHEVMGHFYSRMREISALARGVEHGLQEMFPAGQISFEYDPMGRIGPVAKR